MSKWKAGRTRPARPHSHVGNAVQATVAPLGRLRARAGPFVFRHAPGGAGRHGAWWPRRTRWCVGAFSSPNVQGQGRFTKQTGEAIVPTIPAGAGLDPAGIARPTEGKAGSIPRAQGRPAPPRATGAWV